MVKTKKFALNNSYFKNRRPDDPDTPAEVVAFFEEHGELPFEYNGGNWSYDMVCERQKRRGVQLCQYLTPDDTARRMAELARVYSQSGVVLDACCGTGQITKFLIDAGYDVRAFDCDRDMLALHNLFYPQVEASQGNIRDWQSFYCWSLIVSNPPFDQVAGQEFMSWLLRNIAVGGHAVLLLPNGYMEKTRPRSLVDILACFAMLHREPVMEKFAHTNGNFEIVVLECLTTCTKK